jgi:ABC-type polysaccharide/polyol phosphate export permease
LINYLLTFNENKLYNENTFMSNTANIKQRLERILLLAEIDFSQKYYNSRLGLLWAFINPLMQILTYYYVFTYLIFRSNDPNFVLYLFSGIITWQFFHQTTFHGMRVFQKQKFILENVSIPKIDFFISHAASNLYAYLLNFIIYIIFILLFFQTSFTLEILYILPIFAGLILFSVGISFYLSTMILFIKDMNHIWNVVLTVGFWSVPIIWDYNIIYDKYPFMLYNPITAFLINIRQITVYNTAIDFEIFLIGIITSLLIYFSGYYFMKKLSKKAIEIL